MDHERSMRSSNGCVHAIVVTFQPDYGLFARLISILSKQVEHIHVMDNTSDSSHVRGWVEGFGQPNVAWHGLGDNFGIAVALNAGINRAIAQGATHLLLSDQDSHPADDMVSGLLLALDRATAAGIKIAAVGPTFTDRNTGTTFPFQAKVPGKFFYGHVRATEDRPVVEALTLITSGKLIPVEALHEVGPMREDLFIDKVDIEWCLRARARGWHVFGTCLARMGHTMGDSDLDVWYFGWRKETNYSPLRVYYQVRNYVALCREKEIELRWKIRNGWYTFGVVYSQVFFGRYRLKALRMVLRGLLDGARNRMGRYDPT